MESLAPSRPSRKAPKLLKAADVARRLDVPPYRVYDLVRRNLVPHIRIGRQVRFDPDRLQSWLDSGGQPLGNQ